MYGRWADGRSGGPPPGFSVVVPLSESKCVLYDIVSICSGYTYSTFQNDKDGGELPSNKTNPRRSHAPIPSPYPQPPYTPPQRPPSPSLYSSIPSTYGGVVDFWENKLSLETIFNEMLALALSLFRSKRYRQHDHTSRGSILCFLGKIGLTHNSQSNLHFSGKTNFLIVLLLVND